MEWLQAVTLALAILGAVLGVINTLHALWRDHKVRLRVRLAWLISNDRLIGISVQVVNLSAFEVMIKEIFIPVSDNKAQMTFSEIRNQVPVSVGPRALVTFRLTDPTFLSQAKIIQVGVLTACGVTALSNSVAWKKPDSE